VNNDPNTRFRDSLRMSEREKRRLLDAMDEHARCAPPDETIDDRRSHRRHTYRPPAVAIQVIHPGGGSARYLVGARNLSRLGVGLIHGGFLYDGAECTVVLETRKRELLAFPGRIVTCRHVDGTIHEIGVRFNREIDIETYFQLVEPVDLAPGTDLSPRRALAPLEGRLLYIDPSVAACDQAERFLADQAMEATTARHLGAGLDAIRREAFDVVVCEANLDDIAGDEALTKLRDAGHTGPIAFVTGKPDQDRDARLQELGAAEIALKPLNKSRLHDLLVRCLNPMDVTDPAGCAHAVQHHIDSMQRRIDALEDSIIREDLPNLRIVCESIAHASASEGHDALSNAANAALQMMRESGSTHAALEAVRRVAELAQAIQSR